MAHYWDTGPLAPHGAAPGASQTATLPSAIRLTRDEMRELVRQGHCSKITLEFAESARLLRLLRMHDAGTLAPWLARPASPN